MTGPTPIFPSFLLLLFLLVSHSTARCAEAAPAPRLPQTNLLLYVKPDGETAPIQTIANWQKRRAFILAAMQQVMGPLPGTQKRCALDPQKLEDVDCGNYVRRQISYAAEPGSRVPAYLLVPKRVLAEGLQAPAVLALHQTHPSGQKVVVGLGQSPDDEYGVELVKLGFVVLAPPYNRLADYWPDLKALGYESGTMKSIWDNMRGLDYLSSLPFVKTNGFGAIGHSLGGHNGIYTAVFDKRIKVVVSSCGLDSFLDYKDGNITGWTQDRYMPKLKDYATRLADIPFDFHEIIGALAPRVCFISAPLGDTNFKWRSVDAVAKAAMQVYRLHDAPENLQVVHPDCGHLFPPEMRERAYRLLEQHLK